MDANDPSSPAGLSASSTSTEAACPAQDSQVQRGVRAEGRGEHGDADALGKSPSQEWVCARPMTFREWLLPLVQSQKVWECVAQREPDPELLKNALDLWKADGCPLVEGWQDRPRYPLDLEREKWEYLQVFLDSLENGGASPNEQAHRQPPSERDNQTTEPAAVRCSDPLA